LWRALKAARLSMEPDGFRHGLPEQLIEKPQKPPTCRGH
jgi:hypothetical protein